METEKESKKPLKMVVLTIVKDMVDTQDIGARRFWGIQGQKGQEYLIYALTRPFLFGK